MMPPIFQLNKGECYFVALTSGEVYQGIYKGFHETTRSYWFDLPVFAAATCGPQWVREHRLDVALSLGTPNTGSEFSAALSRILE